MESSESIPLLDAVQLGILVEAGGAEAPELLDELTELMIDNSQSRLTDMLQQLEGGQIPSSIQSFFHGLAGAAANLGCERLFQEARHLEHHAVTYSPTDLQKRIRTIESLLQQSTALIREKANALRTGGKI